MEIVKIVNDELLNHMAGTSGEAFYGKDGLCYMTRQFMKQNLLRVIKMGILEIEPDFLKAEHIESSAIAEIMGEHKEIRAEDSKYGRKQITLPIRVQDESYLWNLNKTTQKALAKAWGNDTKAWVGRKVLISLQEQRVNGKLQAVLYGSPYQNGY